MIYCIILIILTLLLGSIIPFVQYFICNAKLSSQPSKLLFSQTLLDYNMDNLKYEKTSTQSNIFINRLVLNNRGWVRGPNGIIMGDEDFEAKKRCEYDIPLP